MNNFYTSDEVKAHINQISMRYDDGILNPIEKTEIIRVMFYVVYTDYVNWQGIDKTKMQIMRSYDFGVFVKQIINAIEKREFPSTRCGFIPMFLMIDLLDSPWPHLKYERIFDQFKTKYADHLVRYSDLRKSLIRENNDKHTHHEKRMADLRECVKAEREQIIREGGTPPALWPY